MKRFLILILIFLMAFMMVSCKGNSGNDNPPQGEEDIPPIEEIIEDTIDETKTDQENYLALSAFYDTYVKKCSEAAINVGVDNSSEYETIMEQFDTDYITIDELVKFGSYTYDYAIKELEMLYQNMQDFIKDPKGFINEYFDDDFGGTDAGDDLEQINTNGLWPNDSKYFFNNTDIPRLNKVDSFYLSKLDEESFAYLFVVDNMDKTDFINYKNQIISNLAVSFDESSFLNLDIYYAHYDQIDTQMYIELIFNNAVSQDEPAFQMKLSEYEIIE